MTRYTYDVLIRASVTMPAKPGEESRLRDMIMKGLDVETVRVPGFVQPFEMTAHEVHLVKIDDVDVATPRTAGDRALAEFVGNAMGVVDGEPARFGNMPRMKLLDQASAPQMKTFHVSEDGRDRVCLVEAESSSVVSRCIASFSRGLSRRWKVLSADGALGPISVAFDLPAQLAAFHDWLDEPVVPTWSSPIQLVSWYSAAHRLLQQDYAPAGSTQAGLEKFARDAAPADCEYWSASVVYKI